MILPLRFINFIVLTLFFNLFAFSVSGYSDPKLKVLLFKTSKGVIVESSKPLKVHNIALRQKEQHRFLVNRLSASKVILNNREVRKGSLWIQSTGQPIRIRQRYYKGVIEIKPYAKGLYVINHIKTETYLAGVLSAEINTNWHREAVKAQAVIARTFALFRRKKRSNHSWHLYSDHRDQVYRGIDYADRNSKSILNETFSLVVTQKGRIVPTFYHSNSGGITEDPGNLWQYGLPHLEIKSSPYGKSDPNYYWSTTLTPGEMMKILLKGGIQIPYLEDIFIGKRTGSNRAANIIIISDEIKSISAANFRKKAGYLRIQSLLFDVKKVNDRFVFTGTGRGHGVGLSQWGAKDMAEEGMSFVEILKFYFKNISIEPYRG